ERLFIMVSHILNVLAQILDVNRTYRSTYRVPFFPGDIETSRQFAKLASQSRPILLHTVQWIFLQEVLDSHSIVQHLFEVRFGVWSRMIIPQRWGRAFEPLYDVIQLGLPGRPVISSRAHRL